MKCLRRKGSGMLEWFRRTQPLALDKLGVVQGTANRLSWHPGRPAGGLLTKARDHDGSGPVCRGFTILAGPAVPGTQRLQQLHQFGSGEGAAVVRIGVGEGLGQMLVVAVWSAWSEGWTGSGGAVYGVGARHGYSDPFISPVRDDKIVAQHFSAGNLSKITRPVPSGMADI